MAPRGGWVGGVTLLAQTQAARPKPLGVWGLGAELSTRSRGPGSDRRPQIPTPHTRHHARTPCGQVFAAAATTTPTTPPPPLYNRRVGLGRSGKIRGLRRPPTPTPSARSALALSGVMQPKSGGG